MVYRGSSWAQPDLSAPKIVCHCPCCGQGLEFGRQVYRSFLGEIVGCEMCCGLSEVEERDEEG